MGFFRVPYIGLHVEGQGQQGKTRQDNCTRAA